MNINKLTQQFKQLFSEDSTNALGKAVGFCKRERDISPFRLTLGLLESLAGGRVETVADLQRSFNALCQTSVRYKPFYNQLSKRQFPTFMRSICERLMSQFTGRSLMFQEDNPFHQFSKILIHDGSSFGIKSGLKDIFPGRFTAFKPAAVELHVTMDLLSDSVESITLTPDTEGEVHHAPAAEMVAGGLVLLDRMFFVKHYLKAIEQTGGHYIVRSKGIINPPVCQAFRPDGREISSWRGKKLKDIRQCIRRYEYVDFTVCWDESLKARVIATWDHDNHRVRYLVTNLPRNSFSVEHIIQAYRLRWQIELMFKEWKSYANLHSFDTNNPAIAEGLIWASVAATLLKRLLALKAQTITGIAISTRTAAMAVRQKLTHMMEALLHYPRKLNRALESIVIFLSQDAKRAHPEREKVSGRLVLGLRYAIECAA